jgi:hypothetical protein
MAMWVGGWVRPLKRSMLDSACIQGVGFGVIKGKALTGGACLCIGSQQATFTLSYWQRCWTLLSFPSVPYPSACVNFRMRTHRVHIKPSRVPSPFVLAAGIAAPIALTCAPPLHVFSTTVQQQYLPQQ